MVKEKRKADSLAAISLVKNIKQFGFPNLKLLSVMVYIISIENT